MIVTRTCERGTFDNACHPCPNSLRKFAVFGPLVDLQAHIVEECSAESSSRDTIDPSEFRTSFRVAGNHAKTECLWSRSTVVFIAAACKSSRNPARIEGTDSADI